ncbi:MAG: putative phosphinothricin acetyltransferase YwnH [Chroococcopsis gigantea SAG 12.99]|jgi:L-amino acid N-acyltransferase YncA|nr:N-acetyltransferase [Chlorogloea purpurea SAG 13.99]MDV2999273.1 putative phosphinothricin acetyltransferase YwnH [Chroococcopsis gigantea SAG 12.99]
MELVTIRLGTVSDLSAIVDIYNAAIPTRQATADLEPIAPESRLQWLKDHHPEQYPIWVAQTPDGVAGWLSLQMFYGRIAYRHTAEVSLYIAPDYQRRGIGQQLVQHALDHCPALGLTALMCVIFAHNHGSINLFARFGFQRWGFLPLVADLDGIKRDVVILGKTIVSP